MKGDDQDTALEGAVTATLQALGEAVGHNQDPGCPFVLSNLYATLIIWRRDTTFLDSNHPRLCRGERCRRHHRLLANWLLTHSQETEAGRTTVTSGASQDEILNELRDLRGRLKAPLPGERFACILHDGDLRVGGMVANVGRRRNLLFNAMTELLIAEHLDGWD